MIADLVGKGKHIRTVPVPLWAKRAVDVWIMAAGINGGAIFRRVSRLDTIWGDGITPKAIWHVVKAAAKRADIKNLAPHDLRRTCARLCHLAGGELEQIQFLLGHASVQTTERYLQAETRPCRERQSPPPLSIVNTSRLVITSGTSQRQRYWGCGGSDRNISTGSARVAP